MNKLQKGFTLIELMIVVAIIAILAAIAIPAYQDYVIRSQVSEGASLAEGSKTAVAEYFSNLGTFPGANTSAGVSLPASITGNYVKTVTIGAGGKIDVLYSNAAPQKANAKINGKVLEFLPTDSVGSVTWNCSGAGTTIDGKYRPSICR